MIVLCVASASTVLRLIRSGGWMLSGSLHKLKADDIASPTFDPQAAVSGSAGRSVRRRRILGFGSPFGKTIDDGAFAIRVLERTDNLHRRGPGADPASGTDAATRDDAANRGDRISVAPRMPVGADGLGWSAVERTEIRPRETGHDA